MPAFVPELFSNPVVNPATTTLFRRTPYLSPGEYKQAPTAVATTQLVVGGGEAAQLAELAAVISRASGLVDEICFHRPDGTLAACPTTESGWITPKDNGSLYLICNYKPILECSGLAIGTAYNNLQNIGDSAGQEITIEEPIILYPGATAAGGPLPYFPSIPTVNGKVLVAWTYVNGFPHTYLAAEAAEGATSIEVGPSEPGGSEVFGVYPGTQLTIHDGARTEVVVVTSVEGLRLNLSGPLQYKHEVPTAPEYVRVSAIPWAVEQACISLVSYLIKMRGTRAMILPTSPDSGSAPKQAEGQPGGQKDYADAVKILKPYTVPVMRST